MVMAQSLFITLKNIQPDYQIDVLAPAWTFPLLERMPEVNLAITQPLGRGQLGLMQRIKLGKQLGVNAYDQAILLPNSWKSALPPFFANIPVRTGYLGECRFGLLNDIRKLDKTILTMTVQRFVALGLQDNTLLPPVYPIPALVVAEEEKQAVIAKFSLSLTDNILGLCPGAEYGAAKRWPASYFASVANTKLDQGWQVWLFGSANDKSIANAINEETKGRCRNFAGETTLAEAVDLMSLLTCIISNDSGLMHVAAALNKKLIAVYGSSDPEFTPPLNPEAKIVSLNLPCSPCFERDCPLGHAKCLTDIEPLQVSELIEP